MDTFLKFPQNRLTSGNYGFPTISATHLYVSSFFRDDASRKLFFFSPLRFIVFASFLFISFSIFPAELRDILREDKYICSMKF